MPERLPRAIMNIQTMAARAVLHQFKNDPEGSLLGLELARACFDDDSWMSVSDFAKMHPGMSRDTIRRRLENLVAAGHAEVRMFSDRKLYHSTEACSSGLTERFRTIYCQYADELSSLVSSHTAICGGCGDLPEGLSFPSP